MIKKNKIIFFLFFIFYLDFVFSNELDSFLGDLQKKQEFTVVEKDSKDKSVNSTTVKKNSKDSKDSKDSSVNNTIISVDENDENNYLIKNQEKERFAKYVKVRILDKMTGKSHLVEKELKKNYEIKNLEFQFIICWKSYPEELPEEKLLLKIIETNEENNSKKTIFYGWIFSSSPSLNSFENEFYDINLVNCKNE